MQFFTFNPCMVNSFQLMEICEEFEKMNMCIANIVWKSK